MIQLLNQGFSNGNSLAKFGLPMWPPFEFHPWSILRFIDPNREMVFIIMAIPKFLSKYWHILSKSSRNLPLFPPWWTHSKNIINRWVCIVAYIQVGVYHIVSHHDRNFIRKWTSGLICRYTQIVLNINSEVVIDIWQFLCEFKLEIWNFPSQYIYMVL